MEEGCFPQVMVRGRIKFRASMDVVVAVGASGAAKGQAHTRHSLLTTIEQMILSGNLSSSVDLLLDQYTDSDPSHLLKLGYLSFQHSNLTWLADPTSQHRHGDDLDPTLRTLNQGFETDTRVHRVEGNTSDMYDMLRNVVFFCCISRFLDQIEAKFLPSSTCGV